MTNCQIENRVQHTSERKAPHLCIKMNMEERRALLVGRLALLGIAPTLSRGYGMWGEDKSVCRLWEHL